MIYIDFRLPVDETADTPDQTILSIASSLPTSVQYDNKTLRAELIKLGFTPGPIHDSTRRLYLKKLHALKKTPILANVQGKREYIHLSLPVFSILFVWKTKFNHTLLKCGST